MGFGIESMSFYSGEAKLDTRTLFQARNLDMARFDNLMMVNKSV